MEARFEKPAALAVVVLHAVAVRALSLAAALATVGCGGPDLERANVVMIVIDSLRFDGLSSYGYDVKVSPNIDRFAAGSIRFRHAISAAPITAPPMAAILNFASPKRLSSPSAW